MVSENDLQWGLTGKMNAGKGREICGTWSDERDERRRRRGRGRTPSVFLVTAGQSGREGCKWGRGKGRGRSFRDG